MSPVSRAGVTELAKLRAAPLADLAEHALDLALACRAMAERFQHGGKLLAFGNGLSSTDAHHVAVEFVHPVIVGKRALPAIALTADVATLTGVGLGGAFAHQIRHLAEPDDIALGLCSGGGCENVQRGLDQAREMGLLRVALTGARVSVSAEHVLAVASADPRVVKEVHVTIYHVLWELVHVFLERPGVPR
ncbi:SIS domain-containing protein [Nonomuraea sp. NPDC050643]|uniref:D-sedoheptulose-7-phosphate isomerase n=1 Tax=Nonomuraea sp. NPDC050643 TaxID=3155660 RepID=UPI003405FFA0